MGLHILEIYVTFIPNQLGVNSRESGKLSIFVR